MTGVAARGGAEMTFRFVLLVALGMTLGVAAGCGDDDDSAADAGTDGDTDADTDADSDTDTSPVSCGGLPGDCDDIGSDFEEKTYGCCWDNVVYWCGLLEEEWVMQSIDCNELDMTCAHSDEDGFAACI
jgi:hypothetical protein